MIDRVSSKVHNSVWHASLPQHPAMVQLACCCYHTARTIAIWSSVEAKQKQPQMPLLLERRLRRRQTCKLEAPSNLWQLRKCQPITLCWFSSSLR